MELGAYLCLIVAVIFMVDADNIPNISPRGKTPHTTYRKGKCFGQKWPPRGEDKFNSKKKQGRNSVAEKK